MTRPSRSRRRNHDLQECCFPVDCIDGNGLAWPRAFTAEATEFQQAVAGVCRSPYFVTEVEPELLRCLLLSPETSPDRTAHHREDARQNAASNALETATSVHSPAFRSTTSVVGAPQIGRAHV